MGVLQQIWRRIFAENDEHLILVVQYILIKIKLCFMLCCIQDFVNFWLFHAFKTMFLLAEAAVKKPEKEEPPKKKGI